MNLMPPILLLLTCLLATHPGLAATASEAAQQSTARAGRTQVDYEQLSLADLVRRARAGNAQAQFELGSRFNYGRSVPKNVPEALVWLRRAGLAGQLEAQRLLAVKYFNGFDVAIDQEEAFRWAQRLAEAGDAAGQVTLASMYANGEGVPRSLVRSYMWYDIAAASAQLAAQDDALAPLALEAGALRDQTGALLLPDEEQEAQQLASDWWLKKQRVSLQGKPAAKPKAQPAKSQR